MQSIRMFSTSSTWRLAVTISSCHGNVHKLWHKKILFAKKGLVAINVGLTELDSLVGRKNGGFARFADP